MSSPDSYVSLLQWVRSLEPEAPDIGKYLPLRDRLLSLGVQLSQRTAPRALVIGGGTCLVEQSLLADMGFTSGEVISVDQAVPVSDPTLAGMELRSLGGYFPDEIGLDSIPPCDVMISLAASRYSTDAFEMYRVLFSRLRPGSVVVVDFLHQPLIRRAALGGLLTWVIEQWEIDRAATIEALTDLARLSLAVGEGLSGTAVSLESDSGELGLSPGDFPVQRVLYETLFPLWFKPGATVDDALRQIVWQVLYRSSDGSNERIRELAEATGIDALDVFALTPDTNVLIGVLPT